MTFYENALENIRLALQQYGRREAERIAALYERNIGLDRFKLLEAASKPTQ